MSAVDNSERIASLLKMAAKEISDQAFNAALAPIHEVLHLDPGNSQGHLFLGCVLASLGDIDGSINAFRRATELNPFDAKSHMHLGTSLGSKYVSAGAVASVRDILDESQHELLTAIQLDPNLAGAHAGLGAAKMMMDDIDGAIAAYRQAVRLNPEFLPAHAYLALLLEMKGDTRRARHHRRKADDLKRSGAGKGMPKLPTDELYSKARGIARSPKRAKHLDALSTVVVLAVLAIAIANTVRTPTDWVRQCLAAVVGYFTVGAISLLLKYMGVYPPDTHQYPVGGKLFIFDQLRAVLWQLIAYISLLSLSLREGVKVAAVSFLVVGLVWVLLEFSFRESLWGLPHKSAHPRLRLVMDCAWRCIGIAVVVIYL